MKINTSGINNSLYSQDGFRNKNNYLKPSFKGPKDSIIKGIKDKELMKIFSQHYGSVGDRIGKKLYKLAEESKIIRESSRYEYSEKDGALSITDKKVGRALVENILFPFVNMPLYAANFVLKKAQNISAFEQTAKKLYNKSIFRIPRKLNEVDTKTDILKGMLEKTEQTIKKIAKEKGMEYEDLRRILANPEENAQHKKLIEEANESIKENLYKVSNKFFDKHTGNFNTAYERPLNRIVSGAPGVILLGVDAHNLSALCGDSPEESEREGNERAKQEIIRIFTTAYIQLMMFGAFAKQVNTKSWVAPVGSGATVFFSEIFSRKNLDKPIFFLSKDGAKEYNQNHPNKNKLQIQPQNSTPANNTIADKKKSSNNLSQKQGIFKNFSKPQQTASTVQTNETKPKEEKKKALMNFETFKKGVVVLTGSFFALNFLKNSSYTRNTKFIQSMKDFGKYLNNNIYKPLAYKDFEMTIEKFNSVMKSMKEAGGDKIAEGHEFMKGKYAKEENGVIKIYQSSLGTKETEIVVSSIKSDIFKIVPNISKNNTNTLAESLETAIRLTKGNIAEKHFEITAEKTLEIMKNKHVNLTQEQIEKLKNSIVTTIGENAKETPVQIATKMKPFVDVITEPFKFIYSAARLPFKLTTSLINMAVKKVETKAAKAALGEEKLSQFEQSIHRAVTQIYGEKQVKSSKISQTVFANAMEQLEKKTLSYRNAVKALQDAKNTGKSSEIINNLQKIADKEKEKLTIYLNTSVEKSFNGVTQSSNKNTDLALMSKLASSTVTTGFLVADNYNMVMIKSNGEHTDEAKEKANERIIQRLSALFYQALFINWFNATFRSTYNSSLLGMTAVTVPNTLTTEILSRDAIGMSFTKKSREELLEIEAKNENKKGIAGKYYEFMRLLTGKKSLSERLPNAAQKNKQIINQQNGTRPLSISEQMKLNHHTGYRNAG